MSVGAPSLILYNHCVCVCVFPPFVNFMKHSLIILCQIYCVTQYALYVFVYMGQFHQDGNLACFMSFLGHGQEVLWPHYLVCLDFGAVHR